MFLSDWLLVVMLCSLFGLLFTGLPVGFVLGGVGVMFGLIAWVLGEFNLIEFYNTAPRIWGGLASNLILVAAPLFVFMGVLLEKSCIARDLILALQRLLANVPGGLAVAVALVGTLLAASTGIVGASVVLLALLSLPTMLKAGYSPELATGTIAASGTLGIIIPPSIMLIVVADLLSISVGAIFLGALFPGLMIAAFYILYIVGFALIAPQSAPAHKPDPDAAALSLSWLLTTLFVPLGLISVVLGSIVLGLATPTEAAGVGAACTLLLALLRGRLDRAGLIDAMDQTARTVGFVFFVFIGATVFSYVFRSLGGDDLVIRSVDGLGLGSWGVLALILSIAFILGFFFDWIEISLIMLPIFAPVFALMDFEAHVASTDLIVWIAVLFSMVLQTSFMTPPFAFTLFFLRGVSPPEVSLSHLYRGVVPFVAIQVMGIALCLAFPALITWLPDRAL